MKNNVNFLIAIGMLTLVSLACSASFTTANLSELKFGKNKKADPASETFKPADEIFVVSEVNNTSDKHKVKFRLMFDDVKGQKAGAPVPGLGDGNLDVPGSSYIHFSANMPGGFQPGVYRAEVVLLDEKGEKEIDRKEGTFTVASGSAKKFESEFDEDSAAKSFAVANGNANSNTDAATRAVQPGIRTVNTNKKSN